MSELPHDANAIDQHPPETVASVSRSSESAWRKRPRRQPADDRRVSRARPRSGPSVLNDELTRIDADYRRKHAQACSMVGAAVLNSMQSVPVVEATDGGTLVQTDTEEADATPNPASIQGYR